MKYSFATFEQDAKIDTKMCVRSLLAACMTTIPCIAAWYEDGEYYFLCVGQDQPIPSIAFVMQADKMDHMYEYYFFAALHLLAKGHQEVGLPPSRPLLDPIYFGC